MTEPTKPVPTEPVPTQQREISLPDGRTLNVLLSGLENGLPLVLHHGTPGGLVAWPATCEAAKVRGMRLIMPARPGYAGSTPRPGTARGRRGR